MSEATAKRPVCILCGKKEAQKNSSFCSDNCDVLFHYVVGYNDWQLQEKER